jgi:glycosyltransferase 2 family protein
MASIALFGVAFVVVVMGVLYFVVFFPERVISLFERFARRVAPKAEERGKRALGALTSGLSVLRAPSRFAAVFGWTLAHWLVNGLAFWVGFKAVGIDAPYSAALFLQGIIAIGVAAPQAPGFFGVFELFGKEGLRLYGVAPDAAVTWAISFHALSYLPITIIGAWYFLREGLSLGEIGGAKDAGAAGA